jgi:hypothetical protein
MTAYISKYLTAPHVYADHSYTPVCHVADVDFGVSDKRGRAIGAQVSYQELTISEADVVDGSTDHYTSPVERLGHWFVMHTTALRGGKPFGASFNRQSFRTAAERDAAKDKYLKGAAKRALKEAAKA